MSTARARAGTRTSVWLARWVGVRRVLLVLAVLGLLLGVGDRDEAAPQPLPPLDVLVAVDRTTSMSALDDPSGSRITAARRDLERLGSLLPGAEFSVVGWGRGAATLLPFTSDRVAYADTVRGLQVEPAPVGSGSSVSRAVPRLVDELDRAADRNDETDVRGGDRLPVLVLVTDGEHTSPQPQRSFAPVGRRIEAGVVLGYGTPSGAVMPLELVKPADEPPTPETVGATVTDRSTGEPAVSRTDTANLALIADQLGTPYVQRTPLVGPDGAPTGAPEDPEDPEDMAAVAEALLDAAYAEVEPGEPERERRWVWAIAVLVLVLPELRRGWRGWLEARRQAR